MRFMTRALSFLAFIASGRSGSPLPLGPPATVRLERPTPTLQQSNPSNVQFTDVTAAAGIHFRHDRAASDQKLYLETMGAGAGWIDYDQDGFLDAILINSGYTPFFHPPSAPQPAPYRNKRDGPFTDGPAASGIHSVG